MLIEQFEKFLRALFARPHFAALLVGGMIHFLNGANLLLIQNQNYLYDLGQLVTKNPTFGILEILIPFIVPYIVIAYGRRVSKFREKAIMSQFPDLNPDIVVKTNSQGKIEYINPAARLLLKKTLGNDTETAAILPKNFAQTVSQIISSKENTLAMEHRIADQTIEYTINCSPQINTVFVAGRNVSQRRLVEQYLHDSQNMLREMSELIDNIFESYDPLHFNLNEHFKQIVSIFLQPGFNGNTAKPTHVFLTSHRRDDIFSGLIYSVDNETIRTSDNLIEVDWSEQNRFCAIQKDVYFFNVEESGESIDEFQQRFSQALRDDIGIVQRYATYRSGNIAVMAVYQGDRITQFEAIVLKSLAIYSNALLRISLENKATEDAFVYAIDALARASEINDEDTGSHITRINEYCRILATELGQTKEFIRTIFYSAQMHDVGKIHTPADILKKPGSLTPDEFRTMQQHTIAGARILGNSPRLQMAAEIARSHHEKFDGSGYPDGLVGEAIPLAARIVAVADVYDALRQKRVYKEAMSHNEAMHILVNGDERTQPQHFDPLVIEALLRVQDKFDKTFSRYDG